MRSPGKEDNMGNIKLTLAASTLKKVNNLATEFEKTKHLDGSLRIATLRVLAPM